MKLTPKQAEILEFVRDFMAMPERTRGVRERLEDAGLVQNMYMQHGVWMITEKGMEALANRGCRGDFPWYGGGIEAEEIRMYAVFEMTQPSFRKARVMAEVTFASLTEAVDYFNGAGDLRGGRSRRPRRGGRFHQGRSEPDRRADLGDREMNKEALQIAAKDAVYDLMRELNDHIAARIRYERDGPRYAGENEPNQDDVQGALIDAILAVVRSAI